MNPKEVDRFAIFSGGANNRPSGLFISRTEQGFTEFFEKVYDGQFPLFQSIKTGKYYLQFENDVLVLIPSDRPQRKLLFDRYLPNTLLSIGVNAYAGSLGSFKRFANFLSYPQQRYPNRYIGVSFAFGSYNIENYTSKSNLRTLYPEGSSFDAHRYSAAVYLNQVLNKRGNLALHMNLGLRVTESNGYFEDGNEILTHAIRGNHAFTSLLLYRYFRLGQSHPFIGFGADINLLLEENSVLAIFSAIESGYNLSKDSLAFFDTINFSPLVRLGTEIPLTKRHFLLMASSVGLAAESENKRSLLLELSLGLNLL